MAEIGFVNRWSGVQFPHPAPIKPGFFAIPVWLQSDRGNARPCPAAGPQFACRATVLGMLLVGLGLVRGRGLHQAAPAARAASPSVTRFGRLWGAKWAGGRAACTPWAQ